jgi:hypothetical protein
MKTYSFVRFVPSFGQTFGLAVLSAIVFFLAWCITHNYAVDSDTIPRVSCSTTWKQNDKDKQWNATSACAFGKVETTFSLGSELYRLTTNGRPNQLACWEIKYPSGTKTGCEIPK